MIQAIALPLVALLAGIATPADAFVRDAGGSSRAVPADRGVDPADRDDDEAHDDEVDPCPTHLWTVPVEIEGLACVLLLPKEDPGGTAGRGRATR